MNARLKNELRGHIRDIFQRSGSRAGDQDWVLFAPQIMLDDMVGDIVDGRFFGVPVELWENDRNAWAITRRGLA